MLQKYVYCVLDRPVIELNQILLHPELTLWWSSLLPLLMVPTTRNLAAPPTSATPTPSPQASLRYIVSPRWHNGSNIVPDSHPFHSKSNDPPIPKIWLFENFTLKIQIWWSLLEWVMSYHADKFGVDAVTAIRTDKCRQWQYLKETKLALGNDLPISENDLQIFLT